MGRGTTLSFLAVVTVCHISGVHVVMIQYLSYLVVFNGASSP